MRKNKSVSSSSLFQSPAYGTTMLHNQTTSLSCSDLTALSQQNLYVVNMEEASDVTQTEKDKTVA